MAERPAASFCNGVAKLLGRDVQSLRFSSLAGGVSSDIWRVDTPDLTVCAKRALPRLRVAEIWNAPVERNREEVRWLRYAGRVVPGQVPEVIAHDENLGIILLAWFDPAQWQNFKVLLLAATAPSDRLWRCACEVGRLLGRVHSASKENPELAEKFSHFEYFNALRLEPFLRFTATRHPSTATIMNELVETLSSQRWALVHGDVSPKNVLLNECGDAVLLDAECACWGNPAFDVAFMMTHLLLKVLHAGGRGADESLVLNFWYNYQRQTVEGLESRQDIAQDRQNQASDALEITTARLIPALLLARVDGKSPVEYLTEGQKNQVRRFSRELLLQQRKKPADLTALVGQWCTLI